MKLVALIFLCGLVVACTSSEDEQTGSDLPQSSGVTDPADLDVFLPSEVTNADLATWKEGDGYGQLEAIGVGAPGMTESADQIKGVFFYAPFESTNDAIVRYCNGLDTSSVETPNVYYLEGSGEQECAHSDGKWQIKVTRQSDATYVIWIADQRFAQENCASEDAPTTFCGF